MEDVQDWAVLFGVCFAVSLGLWYIARTFVLVGKVPEQVPAWRVFSEDNLDARDADTVHAETAGRAAELYAEAWDRGGGDGYSLVQRVGVVGPDGVAVFFVYTDDGRAYRAGGSYFRKPSPAEVGAEDGARS